MKSIKLSLTVLALLLSASVSTFAQTDVEATATMTATVNLTAADVAFGEIEVGNTASMDVSGVVTTAGAQGGSPSTGSITVASTDPSGTISMSWSATASLENATGDAVTFTPSIDITAGPTATNITSGNSFVHTTGVATVLTIYGDLTASSEAGAFSTETGTGTALTFTASYL